MSKSGLSPHIRYLIEDMRAEWRELDAGSRRLTPSWSPRRRLSPALCDRGAECYDAVAAVGNHVRSCGSMVGTKPWTLRGPNR